MRELQAKLEELESALYCAICFDARLQVVFQCGHQVRIMPRRSCGVLLKTCFACAEQLKACHICRQPIERRTTVFN